MKRRAQPEDMMLVIRKLIEQSGVTLDEQTRRTLDTLASDLPPGDPERLREALAEALPDLLEQRRRLQEQMDVQGATEPVTDVQSLLHPDVARKNLDRLVTAWERKDGREVDRLLKEFGEEPVRIDSARLEREARESISISMAGFRLKPLSEA